MNGIINVLKPPGMTSFDVVALLRGLTGIRKIGHAGTLDPMAAGVLPVCTGRATKAIEFLMDKDKHYRAELTLGIVTDTQDTTGTILSQTIPELSDDKVAEAVASFEGKYMQTPPMHSAVRVEGKRLYELARKGLEVKRQQRKVHIYSAKLLHIDRTDGIRALIDIHCSKGTYIRTLCADIGERLSCGGCMSFLVRMRTGSFDISDAVTLEELSLRKDNGSLKQLLTGVDTIFSGMKECRLDPASENKFRNGVKIPVPEGYTMDECHSGVIDKVRVYSSDGAFIALAEVIRDGNGDCLKVRKFF